MVFLDIQTNINMEDIENPDKQWEWEDWYIQ